MQLNSSRSEMASEAPKPSKDLRLVLQKGTFKSILDSLGKDIPAQLARLTGEGTKLSADKIRFVNGEISEIIGLKFDKAKDELIQDTEIKPSDSPEEVRVKSRAADEATNFIGELTTFIIEKIAAIIDAVWKTVVEIGRKIASFFTDLWRWIMA